MRGLRRQIRLHLQTSLITIGDLPAVALNHAFNLLAIEATCCDRIIAVAKAAADTVPASPPPMAETVVYLARAPKIAVPIRT